MREGHIRDRLLAYRVSRGWTQVRTAEEAGVGRATVENIETGANRKPHRATLMKLALAFGVSLEEFLSDRPPKASGPSLPAEILRRETGHDHLTRSLAETIEFGQAASTDEIRERIRELEEESTVLHEAVRRLDDHLPSGAPKTFQGRKAVREEIRAASKGFVVRVMALAEIGATAELQEEAKQILAEHREVNVPS